MMITIIIIIIIIIITLIINSTCTNFPVSLITQCLTENALQNIPIPAKIQNDLSAGKI